MFFLDTCTDLMPIIKLIKFGVIPLIQIGIPIILILLGMLDLGKAVMSSDDKEIKGATGKLIKRAIAAVAVFFVVNCFQMQRKRTSVSKSGTLQKFFLSSQKKIQTDETLTTILARQPAQPTPARVYTGRD